MTHTPGRMEWHFGEPGEHAAGLRGFPPYLTCDAPADSALTGDDARVMVADMRCTDYEDTNGQHRRAGDMDANARRIAALWNMAHELGLSTEAIEAGCVGDLVSACRSLVGRGRDDKDWWNAINDDIPAALAPFQEPTHD